LYKTTNPETSAGGIEWTGAFNTADYLLKAGDGIIMKSILRKTMVLTVFCSLSIFPAIFLASANFSNPDEGWKSSPADEKTILDQVQAERKPFGEDTAPQAQLRADPTGGGGNADKIIPVGEGIWIIVGLTIAYGVTRRKSKKGCTVKLDRKLW